MAGETVAVFSCTNYAGRARQRRRAPPGRLKLAGKQEPPRPAISTAQGRGRTSRSEKH